MKNYIVSEKHKGNRILRVSILCSILIFTIGASHYILYPQVTKCHLIDFYDFKRDENLYYREGTPIKDIELIKSLIKTSEERVAHFWGDKLSTPKFIYCSDPLDYAKFGSSFNTPACAHMEYRSYVVFSKSGLDLDIIAHELNHTELYYRIGHIKREFEIPIWFDEGLAMQVDLREYYSTNTLKKVSNNFQNLPDIKKFYNYEQFGKGTKKEVYLNYATAKLEVKNWYTAEKLKMFIKDIKNGMKFDEAYHK